VRVFECNIAKGQNFGNVGISNIKGAAVCRIRREQTSKNLKA